MEISVTLQQLKYIITVAETGTITEAAAAFYIAAKPYQCGQRA